MAGVALIFSGQSIKRLESRFPLKVDLEKSHVGIADLTDYGISPMA